jgi:hypothetical protein
MRMIIAGGRDFNDEKLFTSALLTKFMCIKGTYYLNREDIEIVSGMAKGADSLGVEFAKKWSLKLKEMPADWDKYGKAAGYKRNEQMALYAKEDHGVLIAFWDGKSKGTKHMINLGKKHELTVFVINY